MNYRETTQVPNVVFDVLLKNLTLSELKVLLVVIRLTNGWVNKRTGRRKHRAWITYGLFRQMTGLSRRSISSAVQSLVSKRCIEVTDHHREPLSPEMRRGKETLYYRSTLNLRLKYYGGEMRKLSELINPS